MALRQAIRRLPRPVQHRFTLVEMLAAVAVFLVLMLMLFNFISGAQRAWSVASSTAEVYEKARIALDLITRDLQSAVARTDDYGTYDIYFQQIDDGTLRFVSAGAIGQEGSESLLCEVGYKADPADYEFRRALENAGGAGWNVYEDRSGAAEGCVNQQGGFNTVIDGVLGLRFICYDDSMNPRDPWLGAGIETGLPYAVDVQLRLMDSKSLVRWRLLGAPERAQMESELAVTFSKTVFLGGRQ